MQPTKKCYDIMHPDFGRVQVKARTLLDYSGNRPNKETRAVIGRNREFNRLAHLVLDRSLEVKDLILVPLLSIDNKLSRTNGKIGIANSRAAYGAMNLTKTAKAAQVFGGCDIKRGTWL